MAGDITTVTAGSCWLALVLGVIVFGALELIKAAFKGKGQ